jgi:conjugative relaxase-like TrwC/TraI family protein
LKPALTGDVFSGVITAGVIRNGASYLSTHLTKNDYWVEGEKQVQGEWVGIGAAALELSGPVDAKRFEALRSNHHPSSGERLTARDDLDRVAFFDMQLSAPKDVSVLAMVGGDPRVTDAFRESVKTVLSEMERFAAVRERRGDARNSEKFRLTGNFVGGLFFHDASRDLDPQLHAHLVLANATWDEERNDWFALQPAEMLRASGYLRQALFREIAGRLTNLGYQVHGMNPNGFSIRGLEHLRERFSKRALHVQKLANEFAEKEGRRPTKKETEILVRGSRAQKLREISTSEVRSQQRFELSAEEMQSLQQLVRDARGGPLRPVIRSDQVQTILAATIREVFERKSVVREGEFLSAALKLHPEFEGWRELCEALSQCAEILGRDGEITLRSIYRAELTTIERLQKGRNTRFRLGKSEDLAKVLTPGQRSAAEALIESKDFAMVLIGDAGTGKTTVLKSIESAHLASGGEPFIALAPTTRSRDALAEAGFHQAATVQYFLVTPGAQQNANHRVLVIDEAGLLSTDQLSRLTEIAHRNQARLLLVGDTKQHYSVERGDGLRNVIEQAGATTVRLSEVLRQRLEPDRQFSRLLAAGDVLAAFDFAHSRGMIEETGDDTELFRRAADHYAKNISEGTDTLVVLPFWDEIERFNQEARKALRARGLVGEIELVRYAIKPLSWTKERKTHWNQYQPGDQLLFKRDTRYFRRGMGAEVVAVLPDGLRVARSNGGFTKVTQRHAAAFDVGRRELLALSAGDRLLIRGTDEAQNFANGDFRTVARVDVSANEVWLTDGHCLPESFRAWTYGHAQTSYRAQGSTAEESLIVLGEVAERALMQRQFYVGNTRYRGGHHIYVSHRAQIMERLALPDPGRESATGFLERQKITVAQEIAMRPLQRFSQRLQHLWWKVIGSQRVTEQATERQAMHH